MSPDIEASGIRAVAEWVRSEIGVPFVIVGGSAIEAEVHVATEGVDILVLGPDLEKVDSAIEGRKDAYPLDPGLGRSEGPRSLSGVRISKSTFCRRTFRRRRVLRYVRGGGSVRHEGTRRARPAVVFYMRLSLDDWRENVPSIERDLRVGIPESTLGSYLGRPKIRPGRADWGPG